MKKAYRQVRLETWTTTTGAYYLQEYPQHGYVTVNSDSLSRKTPPVTVVPDSSGYRSPTPWYVTRHDWSGWYGGATYRIWAGNITNYRLQTVFPYVNGMWNVPDPSLSMPWPDSNMLHQAEVGCLVKLKGAKANYGVWMAEANKSCSLLASTFLQLSTAYRHAKRRRWGAACGALRVSKPGFKSSSKDVAGRWLELQYGWLPLLGDAYGIYQDMSKGIDPKIFAKKNVWRHAPSVEYGVTTSYGVRPKYEVSGTYGVTVRLDYSLDQAALNLASSMGLTNPLLIAWELVPFSFVLDWAAPIGNWLSALDATTGLIFKGGSYTFWSKGQKSGTLELLDPTKLAYKGDVKSFAASCHVDSFRMNRSVYSSPPFPVPYYKSPASVMHALNALALLRASFK